MELHENRLANLRWGPANHGSAPTRYVGRMTELRR